LERKRGQEPFSLIGQVAGANLWLTSADQCSGASAMPRPPRADVAGENYHVLSRRNGRVAIFHKDADYEAFERVLDEGLQKHPVDLITYQWMPNHWHILLSPRENRPSKSPTHFCPLTAAQWLEEVLWIDPMQCPCCGGRLQNDELPRGPMRDPLRCRRRLPANTDRSRSRAPPRAESA